MPNRPVSEVIKGKALLFVEKQTHVDEVARLMRQKNYGAVLVTENDKAVGIFTERDALYRVVAKNKLPSEIEVGSVMTEKPVCIHVERPFREALHLMSEGGFRHVPVLDGGVPIGMVTPEDMMGTELTELEGWDVEHEHFSEIL